MGFYPPQHAQVQQIELGAPERRWGPLCLQGVPLLLLLLLLLLQDETGACCCCCCCCC